MREVRGCGGSGMSGGSGWGGNLGGGGGGGGKDEEVGLMGCLGVSRGSGKSPEFWKYTWPPFRTKRSYASLLF